MTEQVQQRAALEVRRVLATWADIEDLVSIGAYVAGANREYDLAVQTHEAVNAFLVQDRATGYTFERSVADLIEVGNLIEKTRQKLGRHGPAAAQRQPA